MKYSCRDPFLNGKRSTMSFGIGGRTGFGKIFTICYVVWCGKSREKSRRPPSGSSTHNGRWENGVWFRKHFNLRGVQQQSMEYVEAVNEKNWDRYEMSTRRWMIPAGWALNYSTRPKGKVIIIRHSTDRECVEAMGHRWALDRSWPHRLVRAEVDLSQDVMTFIDFAAAIWRISLGWQAECLFPKRKFKE